MPTALMNLMADDEEFTSCQYCKSSLRSYNNTSSSEAIIPTHTDQYTQELRRFKHLNCEKCGKFINLQPRPAEESIIFICSNARPHAHCICYSCGQLYNVKVSEPVKSSILNQLQYDNSSDPVSTELDGKQPQGNNILSANDGSFSNAETIVNGTTFVAQMVQQMADHDATLQAEASMDNNDGSTLFIGTIIAFCVWMGIYLNSPGMRYFLWFIAVCWLTSTHFHDDSVQNGVYSLFACALPFASLFVFEKTRNVEGIARDVQKSIQFLCVFGCITYFMMIFGPMQMFDFFTNDFMKLSMTNKIISTFIAISIAAFILILTKNCLCLQKMVISEEDKKTMDILEDVLDKVQVCDLSIDYSKGAMMKNDKKNDKTKVKRKRKRKKKKKKQIACH